MGRLNFFRRVVALALAAAVVLAVSQCARNSAGSPRVSAPEEPGQTGESRVKFGRARSSQQQPLLPPDRLEALGDLSLKNRDYETSLVHFLQIVKDQPDRFDIRYKIGVIFLLTNQLEVARRELALVLVKHPEMLEAHEAMGLVHLKEKRLPQAIEEFQLVLAQDPRRAQARHFLGVSFLEAGQTDQAIAELKRAVEANPRDVNTYVALGQANLKLKNYPQALEWLKKGQALDPGNLKVNYQLGMALAAAKRYEEALNAFKKAGDEAQAYNNIGVHYFMEGKYEEAAKCFQRALELRPTFYGEAKANLQRALEKLQQARKNDG